MLTRLGRSFFSTPIFAEDEERTRLAGLLNAILLTALAIIIVYGVVALFVTPNDLTSFVSLVLFGLMLVSLLFLTRRGHVRWASLGFVLLGWGGLLLAVYSFGGVRGASYASLVGVIIIAGILMGGRAAGLMAGLSIVAGGLMLSAERAGNLRPNPDFLAPPNAWMGQSAVFILVAVLLMLADRSIHQALQGARRELGERKRAEMRQGLLLEIANATITLEDLDELYFTIHKTLQGVMPADNFYIALHDPAIGLLSFPYFVDEKEAPPAPYPLGHGLTEYVLRTGTPLLGRQEFFEKLVRAGEIEPIGAESIDWLGVPLKLKDKAVGVMAVQSYTAGVRYSQNELDILSFVSSQVALSIERQRAVEGIRQSEQKYQALTEQIPAVIYNDLATGSGETIYISPHVEEMLGYSAQDWIGDPNLCTRIIHPDDLQRVDRESENARRAERFSLDYRYIARDGRIVWVRDEAVLVKDETGKPGLWQGVMLDITAQKQAEEALRESRERLQLFFNQSLDGFFFSILDEPKEWDDSRDKEEVIDYVITHQHITEANDAMVEQYGATRENFLGRTASDFFAHDLEQGRQSRRKMFDAGRLRMETEERKDDGAPIWVEGDYVCMKDEQGRITGMFGIQRDITERKRAEEQSQLQLRRLRASNEIDRAITSSLDMRLSLDILLDQALSQLGVDAASILLLDDTSQTLEYAAGKGFRSTAICQSRLRLGEGLAGQAGLQRKVLHVSNLPEVDSQFVRAELLKDEAFVEYFGVPLVAKGLLKGVLDVFHRTPLHPDPQWLNYLETLGGQAAIAIDNAQLFEGMQKLNATLEQRVVDRTAQLEAANQELDAFSYSVSHDLRAPLRAVDGYARILADEYAPQLPAEAQRYLQNIRGGGQRMGQLIEDLLLLSRVTRRPLRRMPVNLSNIARAITAELKNAAPQRSIEFAIANGLTADGDPGLLQIVLENLLNNAWKYSSKRARARITFGSMRQPDGSRAFFVRDNGVGFDMAYADKLFGAFQRLHSDAEFEGTGIGLATVQRIIHRHGGRVWAEGEVRKGATFYFALGEQPDLPPGTFA